MGLSERTTSTFWPDVQAAMGAPAHSRHASGLFSRAWTPDKAKSAEFGNAQNLLDWSLDQPMLILHELAHAAPR